MADTGRARKLSRRIKQIVASMLEMQVKDPRLGMVTITDVRMTGDLHDATIFYTVLGGDEDRTASAAALESAKGILRSEVGRQTGVRFTPTLTFVLDSLPDDAQHIDELLAVAAAHDARVEQVAGGRPAGRGSGPVPQAPGRRRGRWLSCASAAPAVADWATIWPVWHEIVAAGDTFAYDPDTSFDEGERMWFGPEPEETWVAGSDDGVLLGTYHLGPNHGGPGSHIANASYMVAPTARGRGVGRAMVEHSLDRTADLGYEGLQFNAVAATNRSAIKLYHDVGFATVGVIPRGFRHPSEGLVDLLIMYHGVSRSR